MTTRTQAALRVTAWTVMTLAFLLLLVTFAICMTYPYINKMMVEFSLYSWYSGKAGYLGLYPPTLLDAFFMKQVLFNWVPILSIALISIWIRHRPFQTNKSVGAFDATQIPTRRLSRFDFWTRQIKQFWLYQLPPRRFWQWWLDGGFNLIDLTVVLLWMALNALWLYFGYILDWPYLILEAEEAAEANGTPGHYNYTALRSEALGYASAWAAVYNLVFVFLPVPRNSFLQYLFNSDFSSIIRYHRWLGHGTLWITLFHGVVFYVKWFAISAAEFRTQCFAWQATGINYLAGSISFFPFGLLLWITTVPIIRRKLFKVFYSFHIIGFLGFIIFLQIHYPQSVWYMPGLALYFMDVAFRMAQWRITSGVQCTFVSADQSFISLRLKINKRHLQAAKVKSSQFIFINVPSVAWFQWHPISIAAVRPGSDNLSQEITLHLKAYGHWSRSVIQRLAERGTINVRIDGPYGYASEPEWTLYDTVIMVSGGIGITPLLSMLREIQSQHRQVTSEVRKLPEEERQYHLPARVHLLWAVRNRAEPQLLDQTLLETAGLPGSWLRLSLFQTSPKDDYVDTASQSSNSELDSHPGGTKIPTLKNNNTPITHQLQPYGFGDIHFALANVLAMVGAFFGTFLASAYMYEGLVTGIDSGEGNRIEALGILFILGFLIGAMGLPALIIYPFQFIRYRMHVRACEAAHKHTSHMEWQDNALAHSTEKKISTEQAQRMMPEGKAAQSGPLDLETGKAATISVGRPNLQRLIGEAVAEHPQDQCIGVIASGPPSLVADAREATHRASREARKLGMKGVIPEVAFSNHSFAL